MEVDLAISLVRDELERAERKFPSFHSYHEGYAVILEEVRELEAEVFRNRATWNDKAIQVEAIQVAAMSIKLLTSLF